MKAWMKLWRACLDSICIIYLVLWWVHRVTSWLSWWYAHNMIYSMVSCEKGPTRHAYAWQIGPFWQDTHYVFFMIHLKTYNIHDKLCFYFVSTRVINVPIFFKVASLAQGHSYDCPGMVPNRDGTPRPCAVPTLFVRAKGEWWDIFGRVFVCMCVRYISKGLKWLSCDGDAIFRSYLFVILLLRYHICYVHS